VLSFQGRVGFAAESGGRYTVASPDGSLIVSASGRMGLSVDSLSYRNVEFINCWDHGRELQVG
jgi:hypothetical protein